MRPSRLLLSAFACVALVGGSGVAGSSVLAYSVPDSQRVSDLTLRRNGPAVELRDARGAVLASRPLRGTTGVVVQGARHGRDTLTVDLDHGSLAFRDGIRYDGGRGAFDSFNLKGGAPSGLHYRATSPGAGTVSSGALRVDFANLEPVNLLGPSASPLFVEATDANVTTLTLADNGVPGDGVNRIFGAGVEGFETVSFSGYDSVVLYGGNGPDSLTINAVDVTDPDAGGPKAALSSITATGDNTSLNDPSADSLHLSALPAGVTAALLGGAGNDTFRVGNGSLDNVLGPVSVDGGANDAGTVGQSISCPSGSFTKSVVSGDVLRLDDAADTGDGAWSISTTTAGRIGSSFANFTDVESLLAQGGSGADQFTVASTPDSSFAQLLGGDGDDTFAVSGSGAASMLQLGGEGGMAAFTVGSTGSGSLVAATGGGGDDSFVQNGNGANSGVTLQSGAGGDTISVHASSPGSLTGHDGSASDTVGVDPGQDGVVCGSAVTAARAVTVSPSVSGRTVTLRWRTTNALGTLGFNVFRQDGGRRVRLTRTLLSGTRTGAGRAYVWRDRVPRGTVSTHYWLQEVQLDGGRRWHGPVAATLRA